MSRLNENVHHLFTQEILKYLCASKIFTTTDFINANIERITTSCSLSYKDTLYLKKYIISKNAAVIRNGLSYYNEILKKSTLLSSGIKSLDLLLGGGFLTGQLYEICGLPSSGKTQLCMTIAKNIASLYKDVYYLDSKNDFRGKKINQMLEKTNSVKKSTIADILSHILVKQIDSKFDLISILYEIKEEILDHSRKIRLIIVDSISSLFHDGCSDYAEINCLLNQFANIAHFLAVECHIVIIFTNILTIWYDGDIKINSNAVYNEKVSLGKYWLNVSNLRLMIKKVQNSNKIEIYKQLANEKSKNICKVEIGDNGLI